MTLDHDVDYWRNTLNAIDRMLTEVPDTMITITSYSMDLARHTPSPEAPLPGGDALDITGPWASDATYADDPTPRQVVIEWCETIRAARGTHAAGRPRYATALRYLRDETPWILESQYSPAWREDLEAVHGRLRALCPPEVDHRHDSRPRDEDEPSLQDRADEIPNDARLTLAEVDMVWPGVSQRVRTARSRENTAAHREGRPAQHALVPDKRGRYRVGDLREYYPDTRPRDLLASRSTSL